MSQAVKLLLLETVYAEDDIDKLVLLRDTLDARLKQLREAQHLEDCDRIVSMLVFERPGHQGAQGHQRSAGHQGAQSSPELTGATGSCGARGVCGATGPAIAMSNASDDKAEWCPPRYFGTFSSSVKSSL